MIKMFSSKKRGTNSGEKVKKKHLWNLSKKKKEKKNAEESADEETYVEVEDAVPSNTRRSEPASKKQIISHQAVTCATTPSDDADEEIYDKIELCMSNELSKRPQQQQNDDYLAPVESTLKCNPESTKSTKPPLKPPKPRHFTSITAKDTDASEHDGVFDNDYLIPAENHFIAVVKDTVAPQHNGVFDNEYLIPTQNEYALPTQQVQQLLDDDIYEVSDSYMLPDTAHRDISEEMLQITKNDQCSSEIDWPSSDNEYEIVTSAKNVLSNVSTPTTTNTCVEQTTPSQVLHSDDLKPVTLRNKKSSPGYQAVYRYSTAFDADNLTSSVQESITADSDNRLVSESNRLSVAELARRFEPTNRLFQRSISNQSTIQSKQNEIGVAQVMDALLSPRLSREIAEKLNLPTEDCLPEIESNEDVQIVNSFLYRNSTCNKPAANNSCAFNKDHDVFKFGDNVEKDSNIRHSLSDGKNTDSEDEIYENPDCVARSNTAIQQCLTNDNSFSDDDVYEEPTQKLLVTAKLTKNSNNEIIVEHDSPHFDQPSKLQMSAPSNPDESLYEDPDLLAKRGVLDEFNNTNNASKMTSLEAETTSNYSHTSTLSNVSENDDVLYEDPNMMAKSQVITTREQSSELVTSDSALKNDASDEALYEFFEEPKRCSDSNVPGSSNIFDDVIIASPSPAGITAPREHIKENSKKTTLFKTFKHSIFKLPSKQNKFEKDSDNEENQNSPKAGENRKSVISTTSGSDIYENLEDVVHNSTPYDHNTQQCATFPKSETKKKRFKPKKWFGSLSRVSADKQTISTPQKSKQSSEHLDTRNEELLDDNIYEEFCDEYDVPKGSKVPISPLQPKHESSDIKRESTASEEIYEDIDIGNFSTNQPVVDLNITTKRDNKLSFDSSSSISDIDDEYCEPDLVVFQSKQANQPNSNNDGCLVRQSESSGHDQRYIKQKNVSFSLPSDDDWDADDDTKKITETKRFPFGKLFKRKEKQTQTQLEENKCAVAASSSEPINESHHEEKKAALKAQMATPSHQDLIAELKQAQERLSAKVFLVAGCVIAVTALCVIELIYILK